MQLDRITTVDNDLSLLYIINELRGHNIKQMIVQNVYTVVM
jgi:hypothetical protein